MHVDATVLAVDHRWRSRCRRGSTELHFRTRPGRSNEQVVLAPLPPSAFQCALLLLCLDSFGRSCADCPVESQMQLLILFFVKQ